MAGFVNTIDILGDDAVTDKMIEKTIDSFYDDVVTSVGKHSFYGCSKLTSINLPSATSVANYAFQDCTSLTTVNLPAVTKTISNTFYRCTSLTSINLPALTEVSSSEFQECTSLTTVNLPAAKLVSGYSFANCYALTSADIYGSNYIAQYAFTSCYILKSVIIRSNSVCVLKSSNAFQNCYHILGKVNSTYNPNGDKDGYIYVPRDLVESYKSASNWSNFASQFRALEDYTVDGTITGELDPTKI